MRHVCWILLLAFPIGAPRVTAQEEHQGRDAAIVPDSSLESPFDIGVSSHTNHLIHVRPARGGSSPAATVNTAPLDLQNHYGMPLSGGSGAIAVVVAFHYPSAQTDFNKFSAQFGLNQETSTNITDQGNAHLSVVYASGRQPRPNSGWSQEAALDIEWSHAMAPGAKIFLVEAASNSNLNLLTAVTVAAGLPGVTQISMSWGGSEYSSEASNESYFTNPNICFFAASGDTGGQIIWPSVSAHVVAAGGTTLTFDPQGNFNGEKGWSGSGGGNSLYIPKPDWQSDNTTTPPTLIGGSNRSVPDLSSDSDPNTGVLVYWSGGWYRFGGTSVASPCLAGMANLNGVTGDSTQFLSGLYSRYLSQVSPYYDVMTGSAGSFSCKTGWDFVTGVGSPRLPASFGK
jgi:subtilase family serine protease